MDALDEKKAHKDALLMRIGDLWATASTTSNDTPPIDAKNNGTENNGTQTARAIAERISGLMHDAESAVPVDTAAEDSPDPDSPDPDNPDPDSPAPDNPDPNSPDPDSPDPDSTAKDRTASGSASGNTSGASASGNFEAIVAGFESVAALTPPLMDNSLADNNALKTNGDDAIGYAFANMVRAFTRQYLAEEFEATIREAISDEMKTHFNRQNTAGNKAQ